MRSIPKDFDLNPLRGQALLNVNLAQNHFRLSFEGLEISGDGTIEIEIDGATAVVRSNEWENVARLPELFGDTVSDWGITDAYRFYVGFSGGAKLHFIGGSECYEDFFIQPPGWVI